MLPEDCQPVSERCLSGPLHCLVALCRWMLWHPWKPWYCLKQSWYCSEYRCCLKSWYRSKCWDYERPAPEEMQALAEHQDVAGASSALNQNLLPNWVLMTHLAASGRLLHRGHIRSKCTCRVEKFSGSLGDSCRRLFQGRVRHVRNPNAEGPVGMSDAQDFKTTQLK
jgi:hypothetical protein